MINLTRKVLCLDWDKRSLRIVAARVTAGKMVLEDAHSHRLPDTVDADDPQVMGDFIRQMLKRHRLRSKWVLVDVPRERAVINRLTLPPTPADEVAAAVRFQAMRELPFPLESAAADYVITKRDEQGLTIEALLAAVTIETLDKVRATCEAAGLTPARIGLRPYANLVSARHVRDLEQRRMLFVDVGPGATEIDIFHGNALAFARSATVSVPIPAGDGSSREDSRIISLAEIADLDVGEGAIEAAVKELLVEVTRTLQAYRSTEPEGTVDTVVVAGGTGIETQFADALHQRLRVPVELFDPTGPLNVDSADGPKLRSFSAALGLAWGLSKEGLLALDFLNPKKPISQRETFQRRVRIVSIAVGAVLVLAAGIYGKYYWSSVQERDRLQAANAKLRSQVKEKTEIQYQIERAEEWAQAAIWPDEFLRVTQAAIDPGKKMLVQGIDMESTSRNQRITLSNVFASDRLVPGDFVRALESTEVDGKRVYDATYFDWKEVRDRSNFKGTTDIHVELRQLREQQAEIEKREKDRKGRGKRR